MSFKRFSQLLLVVLALALWAGTANAQPAVSLPLTNLTYVSGGTNVTATTSTTSVFGVPTVTGDTYTIAISAYTGAGATGWLTATPTTGLIGDTINYALVTNNVASMPATWPARTYTATVIITNTTHAGASAGVLVTLTVTSPLSATGGPTLSTTMTAFVGQASATYLATVTNTDASNDLYTVAASAVVSPTSGCPAYLTWANVPSGALQASSATSSALTFTLNPTAQPAVAVTGCVVTLKYNSGAFATITFTALNIIAQPLKITANPTPGLGYSKGTNAATGTGLSQVNIKTNTGSAVQFVLDVATVAPWLTVSSGLSGSPLGANTGASGGAGGPVVFAVNTAVAGGMATGNYTANVGFFVTGSADLSVPFTLQISNAAPTVVVTQSAATVSFNSSMSTPAPTATLYSTNEPIPFTATCLASPTAPYPTKTTGFTSSGCLMNGTVASGATSVVNGTAFTWGFPMTVTLDPLLFAPTVPIGNTVPVTITFSGLPGGITAAPISFLYTIQPGPIPGPLTVSPSSVAASFKTSGLAFTVLVGGTNFVGPGSLVSGSTVVGTQVWLGTPAVLLTTANAATLGSYVVIDAGHMQVTIVGSVLPALVAGKGALVIGLANQTASPTVAPTVATATVSLNVTNSPVIYGLTSTASYNQPPVGTSPSFAPYDFISLFGDNFGFTGLTATSVNATYDSTYGKIVTPLTLGTAAAAGSKPVTLAVKFLDVATGKISFTAPVLFANQNQINAIVPAGIVGDQYVTITSAGATSDNFLVHVVAADPAIFTLNSDGTGGGAIVNASGTINQASSPAIKSTEISMYVAGLGAPDSTGLNMATSNATSYPGTCIQALGGSASSPSLLSVKNTTVKVGSVTTYTSPAWTNIDGAVMSYDAHTIIAGTGANLNYPPCMATATIAVTIGVPGVNSFTVTTPGPTGIEYAGFVSGSVAGLYQINVLLPNLVTAGVGSGAATMVGTVQPISVAITLTSGPTVYTSQSGVTIQF